MPSCFSPRLISRGVQRKLIRYGDLGNGKIRINFAWGVEKIDFFGTLRQEGIKKAFFRVNFPCIERDSSSRPEARKNRSLRATPFLCIHGGALRRSLFFSLENKFSLKKIGPASRSRSWRLNAAPRASCAGDMVASASLRHGFAVWPSLSSVASAKEERSRACHGVVRSTKTGSSLVYHPILF